MPDFTILEPMSIGDIIDQSVTLYRRNFGPLLAVAAIPRLFGALLLGMPAIPSLIGAFSLAMLFYGYSQLLLSTSTGSGLAQVPGNDGDPEGIIVAGANVYDPNNNQMAGTSYTYDGCVGVGLESLHRDQ
jgi:hypothetical protein